MSYDPSYRTPPRQDRWPNATPQEPWPAYSGADPYRETAGYRGGRELASGYEGGAYQGGAYQGGAYQGGAYQDSGYQDSGADGYWNGHAYDRDNGYDRSYGYGGVAADYGDAWDGGYRGPGYQDDQDGYVGAPGDFAGSDLGEYLQPTSTGALLIAPVIAVGGALIDRTPSAVKNFAVEHFGENDKAMLLAGMYVAIAVLAMVIGCLARRNAAIGVGGIAAFGLLGAFVAITRPEARPTDVVPSVIGGLAGIAAFAWLAWAASPVAPAALAPIRHARAGGHRRAW
jgi:hypothetical protein